MERNCTQPFSGLNGSIVSNPGARFEAEIFASLLHNPLVIRSFEFAIADGAVYATNDLTKPGHRSNYSERFWQLNEEVRKFRNSPGHWDRMLILFDVKSKVSGRAEDQVYITSVQQRARVSFYLGICAANPDYVELIPNRIVGEPVPSHDGQRNVAVNTSRKSLLPPPSYGLLSPCNSLYRMPIALLSDALLSVQRCAQGLEDYTNPWTLVKFTGWKPHIEHENNGLIPREDSQHYTSFRGLIEIWRGIRVAKELYNVPMHLELMWLQPRLADFKLIVPHKTQTGHRQVFVQYKIDGLYRSPSTPLNRVTIARNNSRGLRHYFTDQERFDYLFYQFDYRDQTHAWTKFFFIPEKILPDEFFESNAKESSFNRDEFKPYWIHMDQSGHWVQKVYEIIQQTQHPRLERTRPRRTSATSDSIPKPAVSLSSAQPLSGSCQFHKDLFYVIMTQCAARRSGLLVVLSRGHPWGDFAYCRYNWTSEEQTLFLNHRTLPCTLDNLPPTTPLIPFLVFTRSLGITTRGPHLTTTEFRRLNEDAKDRLLIFDLFGQDGCNLYGPLLVVPSDDISPTSEQAALYRSNSAKKKDKEFESRVPLLAELLHTGLVPTDYIISASGPLVFENDANPWVALWELLNKFADLNQFAYPNGDHYRHPNQYQATLQEVHQRLADKYARINNGQTTFQYMSEEGEDENGAYDQEQEEDEDHDCYDDDVEEEE